MFRRMKRLRAECRWLYLFHIMLIAAGLCLTVWKLLRGQWGHVGLCLLTLAISDLTNLLEPALKLRVDAPLDIAVALFAVCANICGETLGFYLRFPWWDVGLHVIWGFLAGLLGCAFLEAMQRDSLRPFASALAALGFAALTGILWEFFEFAMDAFFPWDMQKDAWLQSIHTVLLDGSVLRVAPETVLVDGAPWPGLLDPGLRDTISDLFLNFLGSLLAAIALLPRPRPRLLRGLMPAPFPPVEVGTDENHKA